MLQLNEERPTDIATGSLSSTLPHKRLARVHAQMDIPELAGIVWKVAERLSTEAKIVPPYR
jgi:hypothetical protein